MEPRFQNEAEELESLIRCDYNITSAAPTAQALLTHAGIRLIRHKANPNHPQAMRFPGRVALFELRGDFALLRSVVDKGPHCS